MSTELPPLAAPSSTLLDALHRVAQSLADRLPSVDTLPLIAGEAAACLPASTVVVASLEGDEHLRFIAVSGQRASELQGVRIRTTDSVAGRAIETRTPILLNEPAAVPDDGASDRLRQAPAMAAAPILQCGEAIGALLAMGSDDADPFSRHQLDLLTLFATHAATAIALDESERDRAEQSRELSVLYRASRSVGGSLNLQEILDSVLDAVCEHLEYQTAVVFLANDEMSHLFVAAERGMPEADLEVQLGAESPLIRHVLSGERAWLLSDNTEILEFGAFAQDSRCRSAMVAPILSRSECHGLLVVTSSQPVNFTDNDLKLVEAVAAHAGIAISNAWLFEDATQRAEHAGALYDLSRRLNATLREEAVHEIAVESVLSLLTVDSAAILLFDERAGRLRGRYARGPHAEGLLAYTARPGHGVAGWVFEWETPQSVAHVAADPRNAGSPLDHLGIASMLAVPMAAGERVLGILIAATTQRRLFTVGEMELAYTVANQTAASLRNAALFGQARAKSAELRKYFRRAARGLGEAVKGGDVPALFAELALAMMRGAVCNIYRFRKDALVLRASARNRTASSEKQLAALQALSLQVARRGKQAVIEDISSDPRAAALSRSVGRKFACYIGVPLLSGNQVRGVLEVFIPEHHENLREEARLLAQFARLAKVSERLR